MIGSAVAGYQQQFQPQDRKPLVIFQMTRQWLIDYEDKEYQTDLKLNLHQTSWSHVQVLSNHRGTVTTVQSALSANQISFHHGQDKQPFKTTAAFIGNDSAMPSTSMVLLHTIKYSPILSMQNNKFKVILETTAEKGNPNRTNIAFTFVRYKNLLCCIWILPVCYIWIKPF